MAGIKPDMSCARVKQYKSSNVGSAERHNERKNDSYENLNVVPERIPLNVHFVDPGEESYIAGCQFVVWILRCSLRWDLGKSCTADHGLGFEGTTEGNRALSLAS